MDRKWAPGGKYAERAREAVSVQKQIDFIADNMEPNNDTVTESVRRSLRPIQKRVDEMKQYLRDKWDDIADGTEEEELDRMYPEAQEYMNRLLGGDSVVGGKFRPSGDLTSLAKSQRVVFDVSAPYDLIDNSQKTQAHLEFEDNSVLLAINNIIRNIDDLFAFYIRYSDMQLRDRNKTFDAIVGQDKDSLYAGIIEIKGYWMNLFSNYHQYMHVKLALTRLFFDISTIFYNLDKFFFIEVEKHGHDAAVGKFRGWAPIHAGLKRLPVVLYTSDLGDSFKQFKTESILDVLKRKIGKVTLRKKHVLRIDSPFEEFQRFKVLGEETPEARGKYQKITSLPAVTVLGTAMAINDQHTTSSIFDLMINMGFLMNNTLNNDEYYLNLDTDIEKQVIRIIDLINSSFNILLELIPYYHNMIGEAWKIIVEYEYMNKILTHGRSQTTSNYTRTLEFWTERVKALRLAMEIPISDDIRHLLKAAAKKNLKNAEVEDEKEDPSRAMVILHPREF